MEEEEEEEEEEQRRKSDAYFSKHFNSHPYSLAVGGTTGHHFNSIGLGFGGSARELERQRQSQILILQRQKQKQRSLESYDDLKNAKEDTKFFSRQSYTESDFEDDDDDDDKFDKYEDKEEEDDDDDDDDNKRIRDTGRIAASHETFTRAASVPFLGLRIWTRWRTIYARNTSCLLHEQGKRFNDE